MTRGPGTYPGIVGWEKGAPTCLHVRPGSLTILECRFNKTTHHPPHPNAFTHAQHARLRPTAANNACLGPSGLRIMGVCLYAPNFALSYRVA